MTATSKFFSHRWSRVACFLSLSLSISVSVSLSVCLCLSLSISLYLSLSHTHTHTYSPFLSLLTLFIHSSPLLPTTSSPSSSLPLLLSFHLPSLPNLPSPLLLHSPSLLSSLVCISLSLFPQGKILQFRTENMESQAHWMALIKVGLGRGEGLKGKYKG